MKMAVSLLVGTSVAALVLWVDQTIGRWRIRRDIHRSVESHIAGIKIREGMT